MGNHLEFGFGVLFSFLRTDCYFCTWELKEIITPMENVWLCLRTQIHVFYSHYSCQNIPYYNHKLNILCL